MVAACGAPAHPASDGHHVDREAETAPVPYFGTWRVVGCATSPKDPANCATGSIVITDSAITVDVPACRVAATPYKLVAHKGASWTFDVGELRATLVLADENSAHWDGCEDGRVGQLSLER